MNKVFLFLKDVVTRQSRNLTLQGFVLLYAMAEVK